MWSCWGLCGKVPNPKLSCWGLCEQVPSPEITKEKFRDWLNDEVKNDSEKIGCKELSRALQSFGMRNCNCKARSAMKIADLDKDGYIKNDDEIKALIDYAVKHWGITLAEA